MSRAAALAALLGVAGCGDDPVAIDAGPPDAAPDAMPGAFACFDLPLPTSAADPVTITGITLEANPNGNAPISGVVITGYRAGTPSPVDTTVSGPDGVFTATLATGGVPVAGYLHGRRPNQPSFRDVYLYPPAPLAIDTDDAQLLFVANNTFAFLQTVTGVSQAPGNAWVGVLVSDCFGDPVRGATVTTTPAYTVKYNVNGFPSADATVTAGDGVAYVFNVTPGDITIDAELDGRSFLEHTILARADVITTTAVAPGPVHPPP